MNQITQATGGSAPQYQAPRSGIRLILVSIGVILSLLLCGAMAMGTFGSILLLLGNFNLIQFNVETSPNWSGYTFPQGNITGVHATWTQPSLSDLPANAHVSTWVGIGGIDESQNNLIQIGTSADIFDGHLWDYVWYETWPANPNYSIRIGTLSPNDHVFASIELKQGSSQTWELSLVNVTRGKHFSAEVSFPSMRVNADFIVEDSPATLNGGPHYDPFPHFTPVTFSKMSVRYEGGWTSLDAGQGIRITLVQSGVTMARPGPLRNDAFTVQRV